MSTDLATLSAECGCSPTTHPDEYRDIARWGVPDLMRQYLIRAADEIERLNALYDPHGSDTADSV
jgi:hypothetical protein